MAKSKVLQLRFPLAGVVRRSGFLDQADVRPPYPTPWAVNVRPEDPLARRLRGGSRLGLTVASEGEAVAGELWTEAGEAIWTEAGEVILVSTGDLPASSFRIANSGSLFAITQGGVIVQRTATGVVDSVSATSGAMPSGYTFGAVYRDRLILAGGDNAIYASRQGAFDDWDCGADVEDLGRATVLQLAEATEVGATPTALVPHKDAFLLAATLRGLWVLRGDPVSGTLQNVSREVGIVSPTAWAKVGDMVVFLAKDGLYQVSASGEGLKSLSEDRLPEELREVDTATTTVSLAYSHDEGGVYLFLTPATGTGTHWFFSFDPPGFWPVRLQDDHQPTTAYPLDGDVVLVGRDGLLRVVGGDDDSGTAIESHVLLGPLQAAQADSYGRLLNLHGILGENSGTVTWRIVAGDSAEEAAENGKAAIALFQAGDLAYEDYVSASGSLAAGRNHMTYPRVRAVWFVVWLQSTAAWAFEGMTLETTQSGRWR